MSSSKKRQPGKMHNSFQLADIESLDAHTRALIERRMRLLGPAYRLFYQNPVELSRAKGVFAYDTQGNEYLDAYNNVACVGHGHPKVVEAMHRQMQTLCTHTRYVQEGILDFAQDLLTTFGGRLGEAGHMMLTCSGSEANDLALRIAQYHTGKRGVIVTSEAYHGTSSLTASISPSLGNNAALGPWVRRIPAPDSYRLPAQRMGAWLAEQVSSQIADLERHGDGLAAIVLDPLFASDGIFAQPSDLLGPVAEVVRNAGALFIADEVQSGFLRTGEKFWGYQRHGIDPDIVSMGKPMGNGFPVAGIVVAPEVVEEFGNDVRYFNTFGGNTVAVAAAQATLNVLRQEQIAENVQKVGKVIVDGLRVVASRHDRIGDVRGVGLYIGVELVTDRTTKEPDPGAAASVVNELRQRRVLISATGPHGNVLKIRPPLVFSPEHALRLVGAIEASLNSDQCRN